jgi:diphthine-ammonia ligase
MMKVFVSWSGGKESCLACAHALRRGYEVAYLLNFVDEDGLRSRSHGIRSSLLDLQAESLGIPILHVRTTWGDYERHMKEAIADLKTRGVAGGVFGDLYLPEHRAWNERVCGELGIDAIFPLWGRDPEVLLHDLINDGFEVQVIASRLGESWLGRRVDAAFIADIQQLDIHPCGELGEYHTFVTYGPIFNRRIQLTTAEKVIRDGTCFLDVEGIVT